SWCACKSWSFKKGEYISKRIEDGVSIGAIAPNSTPKQSLPQSPLISVSVTFLGVYVFVMFVFMSFEA
ncbi:putative lipoprotein, partial [Chlamydia psittaci 06-1683]